MKPTLVAVSLLAACGLVQAAPTDEPSASPEMKQVAAPRKTMDMKEPMTTPMAKEGMMKGDVKENAMKKDAEMQEMMKQEEMKAPAAPK